MSDGKWKWRYVKEKSFSSFRYPTHTDNPDGFWKCFSVLSGLRMHIWVYRLAKGEWYGTFLPEARYGPWCTKKEAQAVMMDLALYRTQ